MKKDDTVYLKHISDAILQIQEYIHGMNHDTFVQKKMVQDAVIRQIEIIGEATKQISQRIRNKYKQIPWNDIAKMKDKLIHYYMGVDIEIVWATIKKDIPTLKSEIEKMLREI